MSNALSASERPVETMAFLEQIALPEVTDEMLAYSRPPALASLDHRIFSSGVTLLSQRNTGEGGARIRMPIRKH